jgi:hypothetical protein
MLSLAQAARHLPAVRGGKTPHPATLFRWATAGRKSRSGVIVRLEMWRVGGTNCTSIEALLRFFDRLNDAEVVAPPNRLSHAEHDLEKQVKEAKDILRRRGVI